MPISYDPFMILKRKNLIRPYMVGQVPDNHALFSNDDQQPSEAIKENLLTEIIPDSTDESLNG